MNTKRWRHTLNSEISDGKIPILDYSQVIKLFIELSGLQIRISRLSGEEIPKHERSLEHQNSEENAICVEYLEGAKYDVVEEYEVKNECNECNEFMRCCLVTSSGQILPELDDYL